MANSVNGSKAPATGTSPATATGARPSPCGCPTPRNTHGSTCTAPWTSSNVISGCVLHPCTGHTSTNSPGPTPTIPPGNPPCGGCRKSSTAGSNPAPCRSPKSTTRSKTKNGSTTTPRRISSWNTPANPVAGSTPCTCSPPPYSTARHSKRLWPTASCLATTGSK